VPAPEVTKACLSGVLRKQNKTTEYKDRKPDSGSNGKNIEKRYFYKYLIIIDV
jgi:hypothetical protein